MSESSRYVAGRGSRGDGACYPRAMASIQEQLRERLSSEPGVRLAVLFGSAAMDALSPASDVDIGLSIQGEMAARHRLEADLERRVRRTLDVVDLDSAPPQLRFEIARSGVLLVERTPGAWTEFRARAFVDWWEFAPIARLVNGAAVRRLQDRLHDGSR